MVTLEGDSVGAGVPQGNVLGLLLWNVFYNDLQLIPETHAYVHDCTLAFPYKSTDLRDTVALVNEVLQTISS